MQQHLLHALRTLWMILTTAHRLYLQPFHDAQSLNYVIQLNIANCSFTYPDRHVPSNRIQFMCSTTIAATFNGSCAKVINCVMKSEGEGANF